MRLGVGYLRVSDNKQLLNHSEQIQKNAILSKAKEQNIKITCWRYDAAKSAFHKNAGKRDAMKQIIADIEAGLEAVVFYDESRISRQINDFYFEIYLPIIEKYPNVKFYSTYIPGEWDPHSPIVQFKLVTAREESEIKSHRAKSAQDKFLHSTDHIPKRPGSREPLGYNMIEGQLLPNHQDSIIVKFIFYLALWGHSNKRISDLLNKNNIKGGKITNWNDTTIDYILNNPVYAGNLAWNVRYSYEDSKKKPEGQFDIFKNTHPPLISPLTITLVKQTKTLKNKSKKLDTPFILRNLLICEECNTELLTKNNSPKDYKKTYLNYFCPSCKNKISATDIHSVVFYEFKKRWFPKIYEMKTEIKKYLLQWKKKLTISKEKLRENEKQAQYNLMLKNINVELKTNLEKGLKIIQYNLNSHNQTLEKINLIEVDELEPLFRLFENINLDKLTNVEVRILLFMFIKKINIKFNKSIEVHIDFNLSPFVEIEENTGRLTEKFTI